MVLSFPGFHPKLNGSGSHKVTECLLIVHEECLETWEDIFVVTAREWRVL